MFLRPVLCLAAASLLAPQPARASMAPMEKYQPGKVIIAFEGGVVGDDIGGIMLLLAKNTHLMKIKSYTVVANDTPCGILNRDLGIPSPCGKALLEALDTLNPGTRPSRGKIRIGQVLQLPDVWLRQYRTARTFANGIPSEETRGFRIKSRWAHLQTDNSRSTARTEQVEFDAYELILGTENPEQQQLLLDLVAPYRSQNVRISSIGFQAAPAKAYSIYDANLYRQDCSRTPPVPPKVDYRSYADVDGDLTTLVGPRPQGSKSTKVFLLDVPLVPSPNLSGAIDGVSTPPANGQWQCAWTGVASKLQHATFLAGIIASQDNGYGFVGLSPSTKIVPFALLESDLTSASGLSIPPERSWMLADMIGENRQLADPYFYLIAASLPDYSLGQAGSQIDPRLRFDDSRQVEQRLEQLKPLFVVAAGQSPRPVALSPNTPMSPQNLGDQRNVLVVTACQTCGRTDATLMPGANYGFDGRYVHVAAPGGAPMIGWVDAANVGEAYGTSQAAAYAAGVIAEMMGRWSDAYRDADLVKKRIQVTSWPLYRRAGQVSEDYKSVATGVIDPLRALLNPRSHWIKDSQGWRELRLRGFSSEFATFKATASGTPLAIAGTTVARFVRVSEPNEPAQWIVYRDLSKETVSKLGEVAREGPVEPTGNIALVPCVGPVIPLTDIEDLIVANGGFGRTPCGG